MKVVKYIFLSLFIPIWHLQKLFPRRDDIWVLGAWFGDRYSDNCRSLFEFVNENKCDIRAVWLTKDKELLKRLQSINTEAYYVWSIKGIFLSLKAGRVIISSGKKDINPFFINGAKIINLWHGSPLKKIGKSDLFTYSRLRDVIFETFYPFIYGYKFDFLISSSKFFNPFFQDAFSLKEQQIMTTGYPRNDLLFGEIKHGLVEHINGTFSKPFIVFYMPTFRDRQENVNLFDDFDFDFDRFNRFFERRNIVFVYKWHYAAKESFDFGKYSRIINYDDFVCNDDLYSFLGDVDLLISDYSSVLFDFMLLDRPILLAPFDIEKYSTRDRSFYFDYQELECGVICENWKLILNEIEKCITKNNPDDKTRKISKERFNDYFGGGNCERVFQKIIEI
jgi:CDP-glycerol glycerophosphotransferase